MIKINGILQPPDPHRIRNGPETAGLKIRFTSAGKKTQTAKKGACCKGNTDILIEEGSYKHQLPLSKELQTQ